MASYDEVIIQVVPENSNHPDCSATMSSRIVLTNQPWVNVSAAIGDHPYFHPEAVRERQHEDMEKRQRVLMKQREEEKKVERWRSM